MIDVNEIYKLRDYVLGQLDERWVVGSHIVDWDDGYAGLMAFSLKDGIVEWGIALPREGRKIWSIEIFDVDAWNEIFEELRKNV